ncbi:DUF11 domain-containing protein [Pedobacter sp. HMF7647]|uniref:DUF11 domain-containing protein n=1 Tax=Hufsiella arboris TaxID=2695275 RepID=A0A7K1YF92_9SPHI|nr:gliding motility-associated C-terminal domain-containing protein [Hufsiella arboris]MXV53266.1 DUF11 domain-containing protein [Hufsiella arboris]
MGIYLRKVTFDQAYRVPYRYKPSSAFILAFFCLLFSFQASAAVIVTLTPKNGTCPGNGSITVTTSGTTGSVLYAIKRNGDADFSPQQASNVFANLASGNYIVAVYDESGISSSSPAILSNKAYTPVTVKSITPGNRIVTACNDDASIDLEISGGNAPYTYHLKNGPSTPADIVSSDQKAAFLQLTSGTYAVDITDACGNTITANNITVTSKYNLQGITLSSFEIAGTTQSSTGCDLSFYFSVANVTLKDISGNIIFERNGKNMPGGYPVDIRVEYPSGSGIYTPWANIFTTFNIPGDQYFPANGTYRVQFRHPCDPGAVLTSPEYNFIYPYSSIGGYCAPSVVRNFSSYNCGPVDIRIKHTTSTAERTFTWNDNNNSYPLNLSGLPAGTYNVFITTENGTYQSNNISTTTATTVSMAFIYNYISTLGCDFTTGGIRSYGIPVDNTVPITYSIVSGPVSRPSVTSTADKNPIWNDLPGGIYRIGFKFGDCNYSERDFTLTMPFGGFNAGEVSYVPGSACGKYKLTGKGWYLAPDGGISNKTDTYGVRIFDSSNKNIGTVQNIPNNTDYTSTLEVGPGTYKLTYMNSVNSKEVCHYLERTVTIPPYQPVSVNVGKSGGVTCDNGVGELHIEAQGGSGKALTYRIKPKGASDASYTAYQSSPDFPGSAAGEYTVQIADACGYSTTQNLTLIRTTSVSSVSISGADTVGRTGVACQGNTVGLTLNIIGRSSNVQWTKPNGSRVANAILTIANFSAADEGRYNVSYESGGCVRSDFVTLSLKPKPALTTTLTPPDICSGSTFIYTPQSSIPGSIIKWTRAAVPGIDQPASSGTDGVNEVLINSTAGALNVIYQFTTSYNGCENVQQVVVKVNRKAVAADILLPDASICTGATAVLNATAAGVVNPVFTWYSDAALNTPIFTGPSFTTPTLNTTTQYYLTVSGDGVCANDAAGARIVTVNVNRKAVAADIQINNPSICSGSSANLVPSATIANARFKWYADAALTQLLSDQDSLQTPVLWTSKTYYATVTGTGVCENEPGSAKAVTVVVKPKSVSSDIVVNNATICSGAKATLTANSQVAGAAFEWYSDAGLTNFLSEGSVYTTGTLFSTTTVYVTVKGSAQCANAPDSAKAVQVIVNRRGQASDISGTNDALVCSGDATTLQFSSTIPNAALKIYDTPQMNTALATGNGSLTYNTPVLNESTTYYVTVSGDNVCENLSANAKQITVTVNKRAAAADLNVEGARLSCTNETATLTASSTLTDPHFKWYSDASLQTLVGGEAAFTTPPLAQSTTYYVTVRGAGVCESTPQTAKAVTVEVSAAGASPTVIIPGTTICQGEATIISASSNLKNPVFTWYADAGHTDPPLYTGKVFSTPNLNNTATYYVVVTGDGVCDNVSAPTRILVEKEVTITVSRRAAAADITVPAATVCSGEEATLSASSTTVGSPVFSWYADPQLNTLLSSGPTFETGALTSNTTYYVTVQGAGVCENPVPTALPVTVTVNRHAVTADILAPNVAVCSGSSATLNAITTTVTNPVFNWYTNSNLDPASLVFTGPDFTTPVLTGTTYYYVTVSGDGVCANVVPNVKQVQVTVNAIPNLVVNAVTKINCNSFSDVPPTFNLTDPGLTAGSDEGILSVWRNPDGTGIVPMPHDVFIPGTYYIKLTNDKGCSVIKPVVVPAIVKPKLVITNPAAACTGEAVNLTLPAIIAGSDPNLAFSYFSDPALLNQTSNPSGVSAAGIYYIQAKANDGSGCPIVKPVNVSFNEVPILTINQPAAVCAPQAVDLTAATITSGSDAGTKTYWLDGTASTTPLTNPAAVTQSGIYYIKLTNASGCSDVQSVTVTIHPQPVLVITNPAPVCSPQTINLTAAGVTAGSSGGSAFHYWLDAASTQPLASPQAVTASGTYYISYQNEEGCQVVKPVSVVVTPGTTAADITLADASICSGTVATLTASSTSVTAPVFRWYTDASLTSLRFTGATFTTGALNADTTYFVTVSGTGVCETPAGEAKAVNVTVQRRAINADITSDGKAICSGSSVQLDASAAGINSPIFKWYADAALTQPLATGADFTTPVLWANSTYYVTVNGTGVCENSPNTAKEVVVTVNRKALPADIIANDVQTCKGSTASISASSTIPGAVFSWYSDAALTNFLSEGPVYTTNALIANTTYYVTVRGTGICNNAPDSAKAVQVVVNRHGIAADITGSGNATVCNGDPVSLNFSTLIPGATIKLYSDANLTTLLSSATGTLAYTTPPLAASTSYYVTVSGDGVCENLKPDTKQVNITVNDRATTADLTVTDASLTCTNEPATLSASSTLENPQFNWYSDAGLQTKAGTGATFITPPLAQTTTYYVTVSGTRVCESSAAAAKPVTVNINASTSTPTLIIPGAVICEGEAATLSAASNLKNPVYNWYGDAAHTAPALFTGKTITTPALNATTTYYVVAVGDGICDQVGGPAALQVEQTVTVTVNKHAVATDIVADDQTICSGSRVTLAASSSTVNAAEFKWYQDAALTQYLATGPTYTTASLTATTTYYVTAGSAGVCENKPNEAKVVTVTVSRSATTSDINLADVTTCPGTPATLVAQTSTVSNPVFNWYQSNDLATPIFTGPGFTAPALLSSATYFVTVSGDGVCANKPGDARSVVVSVNKQSVADDIEVAADAVCAGSAAELRASSNTITAPVFKWYADTLLSTLLFTGPTYTTAPLTAETTFYVTVSGTNVCETSADNAKPVTVKLNRLATASDILAADANICNGSSTLLAVSTNDVLDPEFNWYADAALTQYLHTGPDYLTPVLTAPTDYYVTLKGDSVCANAVGTAKIIHADVNRLATSADISSADQVICAGSTATLQASSTTVANPVFNWYADAGLSQYLGTGAQFATTALNYSTIYYVTVSGSGVCENAANNAKAVNVTVNPLATASDIAITDVITCSGDALTLTATSSKIPNPEFKWYADEALTSLLFTGSAYQTPALTSSTSYFVTVSGTGFCANTPRTAKKVTVTVQARTASTDLVVNDQAICAGSFAILNASSVTINSPVFRWYADNSLSNLLHTGDMYQTPALNTDATYYVTVSAPGLCEAAAGSAKPVHVSIKRNAVASDITAANQVICYNTATKVTASSGTVQSPVFRWYADAALTSLIYIGTELTTPNLRDTKTYYVTVSGNSVCENVPGSSFQVSVVVNRRAIPADITASDQQACIGNNVVLSASSAIPGAQIKWYSDSKLTNYLASGPEYSTAELTSTSTFYVTVSGNNVCENAPDEAKAVKVNVNRFGRPTDISGSGDAVVCRGEVSTINLTTTVGNPTIRLYNDSRLTSLVASGSSIQYITPALNSNAIFYATVSGDGICENLPLTAKVIELKVNDVAQQSDLSVSDLSITCTNEPATLTASSTLTNPVFKWYGDANLQTAVGSGESFTTPPLSQNTTYYVTVRGDGVCESSPSAAKPVTVQVSASSTEPTLRLSNVIICAGEAAELSAASNLKNPVYKWYADAAHTQLVYTGSVYSAPALTNTTIYYIVATGDGVCGSVSAPANLSLNGTATVTVNRKGMPADISVNGQEICSGGVATLTATSTTIAEAEFKWYADAGLANYLATGPTYTTGSLTSNTTYYVTVNASGVCESLNGQPVTVNVIRNAVPSDIIAKDTIVCYGNIVTLHATTTTISNPVFKWYADARLTQLLFTGPDYPTLPLLVRSTTFYVTVQGNGVCENRAFTANEVTVTVTPFPGNLNQVAVSASNFIATLGSTVTLSVPPSANLYLWDKDRQILPGVTGNSYVISSFKKSDAGRYLVASINKVPCDNVVRLDTFLVYLRDFSTWKTVTDANGDGKAQPGEILTYTIHVKNTGTIKLNTLTVSDPLPAMTAYVNGGTFSNNQVTFTDAGLNVDEERTYIFSVRASDAPTRASAIANQAIVKADSLEKPTGCGEANPNANCETEIPVDVISEVKLITWKTVSDASGDGKAQRSEVLTYTVHIRNTGLASINSIAVSDPLPVGTAYVSGGTLNGNNIQFLVPGPLAPNAETSVNFSVKVNDDVSIPTISNQALVTVDTQTFPTGTKSDGSNQDPVITPVQNLADLSIVKTQAAEKIYIGDQFEYQLTVTNNGPDDARNVTITDVLPLQVDYIPLPTSPRQVNYDPATRTLIWILGTLGSGESTSAGITVQARLQGTAMNTATISTTDQDPEISNNSSTVQKEISGMFIPNVITPNGDNRNDRFVVKGVDPTQGMAIRIYNRWGNEVYHQDNYKNDWDGSQLNEGTYFYLLTIGTGQNAKVYKGWIQLLR